jgi:glycosyltransferase involved in cell wall biosynthesis
MNRILFLVQLPPPIHGAAIMNEIVVHSKLIGEHFESRHIDIGASDKLEDIGRFSPSKLPGVARTLAGIIRELFVFRPDIVYLTLAPSGFAFYRDVLFVSFIRLFRPELVLHLHGKGIRQGAEKSRLFRWLASRLFKHSHVIFLSERLRSDAAGFRTRSSYVVNNGFPDDSVPLRAAPDDTKYPEILYLSNFVRSKGVLDLIDALQIVAQTHTRFLVKLVGKPVDISMDALEVYVREKGLDSKVSVLGPLYGENKVGLLEGADIFILPSYNEAFPLSVLEAMKFGLPVISTIEGGIPDMIDAGRDGLLFPKRDVGALAREIVFLLDHPKERRSIGEAAQKKFSARFTVSVFERNLLQVFQQICLPAAT